MQVGRNTPCPCGSGAKYKRCCLARSQAATRSANEVGATYQRLVDLAWDRHSRECIEGFERYFAPLGRRGFGTLAPDFPHVSRAQAWYLFEPEAGPGRGSILDALAGRLDGSAALAGSAIRLWRLGESAGEGWATVTCPLTRERRAVWVANRWREHGSPGPLLATRTVPLAEGRALAFGPVAVAAEAEDDLIACARRLLGADAGSPQAWAERAGELSRQASNWPEERVHTREGEIVRSALSAFELRDRGQAARRLEVDPELDESHGSSTETGELDECERSWSWRPVRRPPSAIPAPAPGVRWRLDRDDAEFDRLAQVVLDLWEERLLIYAATPRRLDLAERHVTKSLGRSLGRREGSDVDRPDVTPHWQAERLGGLLRPLLPERGEDPEAPEWGDLRAA